MRVDQRGLALIGDGQRVVGNIDDDMRLAEVARHPAPALHVGDQRVDEGCLFLFARFGQLGLQRLVGCMRRVIGAECIGDIAGVRDVRQHVSGLGKFQLVEDRAAHAREADPAGARMARESQDGLRQRQLVLRELVGFARKARQWIVGRLEPVGADAAQECGRRLGAIGWFAVGSPQRRKPAIAIERFNARAILLAFDDAVEFRRDHLAQFFGDCGVVALEVGRNRRLQQVCSGGGFCLGSGRRRRWCGSRRQDWFRRPAGRRSATSGSRKIGRMLHRSRPKSWLWPQSG